MRYQIRAGRQTVAVDETLLDRTVRYFDPVRARARIAARLQMAAASGAYQGGSRSKRSLSRWLPGGGSADADLLPDLPDLRQRTRDLVRNAPLAAGALNTVATNVVGTGLMPKATPKREILGWDEARSAAWKLQVEQEFAAWAESTACDAARTQTFYGLQDLAFRSALENGDCFALLPMPERGARYRTAVQLVEADRVSNKDNTRDTPELAGGVALDAYGAPVSYHIRREHPGDITVKAKTWDVVPAFGAASGRRNVLHLYSKRRVGQTRGAPYLTPVIEAFKSLDRYTEAEIFAAVANAMFAIKVTSPDKSGLSPLESAVQGTTPASGTSDARDSNWDGGLTAGLVVDLGENEDVASFTPGRPNAGFDPFVQAILRQVGVALELPFEVLVKHFNASYSAARSALLEAWKFYRGRRAWLAEMFCQPVWEAWLAEAVARGRVDAPGFFSDPLLRYAYAYAHWYGDGPGSIDPLKEVSAIEKRLAIHLTTLDEEISENNGGEWGAVLEQAGREREKKEALGLNAAPQAASAPEPGAVQERPEDEAGSDAADAIEQLVGTQRELGHVLRAIADRPVAAPAAPPPTVVHINQNQPAKRWKFETDAAGATIATPLEEETA